MLLLSIKNQRSELFDSALALESWLGPQMTDRDSGWGLSDKLFDSFL